MRVYAESNLVLEHVLEQDQWKACEAVLLLAERARIELVLPAFALLEPYQTIERRSLDRQPYAKWLGDIAVKLGQTASLKADVHHFTESKEILTRASENARARYDATRKRLLDAARLIEIDAKVIGAATSLQTLKLKLPDALILSCILSDVGRQPEASSLFLNANKDDFSDNPDVRSKLKAVNCRLVPSFEDGLRAIKAALEPGA